MIIYSAWLKLLAMLRSGRHIFHRQAKLLLNRGSQVQMCDEIKCSVQFAVHFFWVQ